MSAIDPNQTVTMYGSGQGGISIDFSVFDARIGVLSSPGNSIEVPRRAVPWAIGAGLRLKLTIDSTDYFIP